MICRHFEALLNYLGDPTQGNLNEAVRLAEVEREERSIRGSWGEPGELRANAQLLLNGDQKTWGLLLQSVSGVFWNGESYDALKAASPFAGKIIVIVGFCNDSVGARPTICGDFESLLERVISDEHDFLFGGGNHYLVVLNSLTEPVNEVVWLGCNCGDSEGCYPPRNAKGEFKEPRKQLTRIS